VVIAEDMEDKSFGTAQTSSDESSQLESSGSGAPIEPGSFGSDSFTNTSFHRPAYDSNSVGHTYFNSSSFNSSDPFGPLIMPGPTTMPMLTGMANAPTAGPIGDAEM
jgi:hypothetical protein